MDDFKYFKSERVYNELYYQFPKVLMESDKYSKLSDGAKLAYMLLKARLEVAIYKGLQDENGYIYFEYTNIEMQNILNCGNQKVNKIKKELQEVDLLKQKRMGFNKIKRENYPNRLYLAELEVTEKDIYKMQKRDESLDNSGNVKITLPKSEDRTHETLDNSGNVKITLSKNNDETLDNSGNVKITQVFNNTKDYKDTYKDTVKEQLQNSILLDNFSKTLNNPFLGADCLNTISTFSNTIQEAQNTVGIIMRAKKQVETENNIVIVAEYYQEDVKLKLTELYLKIKTDNTIKNKDNYMFIAFLKMFKDFVDAEQAANNTLNPSFYIPIE